MPDDPISLDLLARLCQQTLQETRATRKELADVRTLSLQTIDYARRIERRVAEQRDDLELMIKAVLGGSLASADPDREPPPADRGPSARLRSARAACGSAGRQGLTMLHSAH